MAELLCEAVGPGLRDDERCVEVRDVLGHREFLLVPHGFLTALADKYYLPVGVIGEDRDKQLVLIELPQEGIPGQWRLWVRKSHLIFYPERNSA
jgi:hypothetical protein